MLENFIRSNYRVVNYKVLNHQFCIVLSGESKMFQNSFKECERLAEMVGEKSSSIPDNLIHLSVSKF